MKSAKENEEFGPIRQESEGNRGNLWYGFTTQDLRSSGPINTTPQGMRDDDRTQKRLCKDPEPFPPRPHHSYSHNATLTHTAQQVLDTDRFFWFRLFLFRNNIKNRTWGGQVPRTQLQSGDLLTNLSSGTFTMFNLYL